ncbi:MAG: hypothetical protein COU09_02330 [Candidatus Harrisonbacteria bacterium CG10_big_fil_rev_8_21_14_0_10_44_23]|uniref:Uncharacterized protein n=1 Tax=Candidatus Harrisonbacteria bacterium CG10_big_fil_rev_8_21_14_0_10_44_23 TaxID=1974585 RepID=A0A2H0URS7_9BACT|nr:MAG: hypothetical protein COU09_02330 [Candidatus Harrisonbacteria bacterium CG10_big_fil_rev_8_21_14_0_10_44_23]
MERKKLSIPKKEKRGRRTDNTLALLELASNPPPMESAKLEVEKIATPEPRALFAKGEKISLSAGVANSTIPMCGVVREHARDGWVGVQRIVTEQGSLVWLSLEEQAMCQRCDGTLGDCEGTCKVPGADL